jgi:serine/threonine-protein kinase
MTTMDERRGTVFAGRYLLERKLGSGGMADVWLAEDQELGRKVAIKMLHERYANDAQFVERFRREATHAAGLSHPNVVAIYDRGEAEGSYFIVMEYVEGRTLKELIVTRGMCPVPVAISYTRQVLAALRYAHRNGIVHRDIKPHNVLVDNEGRVKVADFGIARAGSSQMTEAGSIIGTAQYLSPEQARGAPVDESSDLYSTGIVLYELLTGKVPFTGETPVEIAMKHLSQIPEPPSTLRAEIPRDLDLVVLRALAKEPADRYRSAKEMDRDLELVGRGETVGPETEEAATMVLRGETTAQTAVAPPVRPAGVGGSERYRSYEGEVRRGRPLWPWLLGVGLAVALGIGGWLFYDNVRDQIDANEPVAVDDYQGILERKAVALINKDGFEPNVRRLPNNDAQKGYVYDQEPDPGSRQAKGSMVTILVSSGKRNVTVPSLVGKPRDTAVKELTSLGLDADVHEVPSDKQSDTVTAQDPVSGTVVVEGASVRVNVSSGPKPVAVPAVIGSTYDTAAAQLQSAGFTVGRVDVESDQPAGQVVDQDPPGNSTASRGSSITLSVSQGPKTVAVPDVSLQSTADARATLRAAGFRSTVTQQETDDEALDGLVISQDPAGNAQADPKSTVTLTVGTYVPPPDVTTPTTTTPTTTAPTTTTPTTTTPTTTTPTTTLPTTTTTLPPPPP